MSDQPTEAEEVAPEVDTAPEPERWHGVVVERDSSFSRGQLVAHPTVGQYVDFVRTLRDEEGYLLCLDVIGVDYLSYGPDRALPAGIEIRVTDSGLGLPADEEDEPAGPSARPGNTSYGLRHVRDRLRVLYGPAARLSLERRDPTGVCAVVFIPT